MRRDTLNRPIGLVLCSLMLLTSRASCEEASFVQRLWEYFRIDREQCAPPLEVRANTGERSLKLYKLKEQEVIPVWPDCGCSSPVVQNANTILVLRADGIWRVDLKQREHKLLIPGSGLLRLVGFPKDDPSRLVVVRSVQDNPEDCEYARANLDTLSIEPCNDAPTMRFKRRDLCLVPRWGGRRAGRMVLSYKGKMGIADADVDTEFPDLKGIPGAPEDAYEPVWVDADTIAYVAAKPGEVEPGEL